LYGCKYTNFVKIEYFFLLLVLIEISYTKKKMSDIIASALEYLTLGSFPKELLMTFDFKRIRKALELGANHEDLYAPDGKTLHIRKSTFRDGEFLEEFLSRNVLQILHIIAEMYVLKGMCIRELFQIIYDNTKTKSNVPNFVYLLLKQRQDDLSDEFLKKLQDMSLEDDYKNFLDYKSFLDNQENKSNEETIVSIVSFDSIVSNETDKMNEMIEKILNDEKKEYISPHEFNMLTDFLIENWDYEHETLLRKIVNMSSNLQLCTLIKLYIFITELNICQFDEDCITLVNAIDQFSIANGFCYRTALNC